jgi:site-specific DNA-methyltransferase (adenine-specific)
MKENYRFFNEDCIEGAQKHLEDNSVDLMVTDPPYGIEGDQLHRHYNRKEEFVIDGYVEVPQAEYADFSRRWVEQAARVLRPGGSIYVVSGYTHLPEILTALRECGLEEMNHIIWKYNFGVYTRNKYVSSHYHILFYVKPGAPHTFNLYCRKGPREKAEDGQGSANYRDREDVWIINREYKPGKKKNKNELPKALLEKILQYSSNEGDLVADFFLGSFSTAKVALGMNRKATGFELSRDAFQYQLEEIKKIRVGELIEKQETPLFWNPENTKRRWAQEEKEKVRARFKQLRPECKTKRKTIDRLSEEFGRGYFSILNVIDE